MMQRVVAARLSGRRAELGGFALVALALMPSACGGGEPAASPAEAPTATATQTPEPASAPKPPTETTVAGGDATGCPDGLVLVQGGQFWMGSGPGQGEDDEHPRHSVEVLDFCLGETEVTLGIYQACVKNGICDVPPTSIELFEKKMSPAAQEKRSKLCSGQRKDPELPVNCVNQEDAEKFCKWKGLRLPTEAEFEYAAAAGADEMTYPWGDAEPTANNLCWSGEAPCKVKSVKPGAYGLYDIAGNLAEWTSTPYGNYQEDPAEDADPVVRGASWMTKDKSQVAAKRRSKRSAITRDIDLGFRCAKTR